MAMKLDAIKNNYDKVILALVLLFFIYTIYWFISDYSSNSYLDVLSIYTKRSKYKPINKTEYLADNLIKKNVLWSKSEKRSIDPKDSDYILTFTDFIMPFKIARSNAVKSKHKLIPYIYYEHGYDPISKEKISLTQKAVVSIKGTFDTDKDGISDVVEKQYGMNPKNALDLYWDNDNDSFSNIGEFRVNRKGINDEKIHPAFIKRLVLSKIENTKILFILKNVVVHGEVKKNWIVQAEVKIRKKGWRTKFYKLNSVFTINNIEYKIVDIINRSVKKLDPRVGSVIVHNISEITLKNSNGDIINVKPNQTIFEPSRKITFKDLYTGEILFGRIGDTTTIGNSKLGYEKYKIISIDKNNSSVTVDRNSKKYTVLKTSSYKPPVKKQITAGKAPLKQHSGEKSNDKTQ